MSERAITTLRARSVPPSLALLLLYAVTLVSIPSDVGLATGVVKVSPARLVLVLALIVTIIERFRAGGHGGRPFPRKIGIAWAAYLAASLVTTALHPSIAGATRLGSYMLEGFAVMWVVWEAVWDHAASRLVERALVITSVVVAGASTGLALIGQRYDVIVHSLQETAAPPAIRLGLERQQGPFDAPLFYAVWLVSVSALILPLIEGSQGRSRWLWVVAWILVTLATVTTVSRMAVVGLPLVVAAYLVMRGMRREAIVAFGIAFVLAVAAFGLPSRDSVDEILPLPPPATSPLPGTSLGGVPVPIPSQPQEDDPGTSTQARFEAIRATAGALAQRPIFGWGLLNAKEVALAQLGKRNYVDNSYLVLLIETGVVGLAAFLFLVGSVVVPAVRSCKSATSIARLVACLSILFSAGYAAVFSITQLSAAFWLVSALLITGSWTEPAADAAPIGDQLPAPSPPGSAAPT